MARILIISAVFPPEPVVSATLSQDIAEELSKKNDVIVLCPRPTRPSGFKFENGFNPETYKVVLVNSYTCAAPNIFRRLCESYSFGKHCAKYISKSVEKPGCIYLNSWPLFSQYLIVKAAKKISVPSVIHIQDVYPESLANKLPSLVKALVNFFFLPLDKSILRNTTRIVGISQSIISYLSVGRKIDKNKFVLIRNWQDDTCFLNYTPRSIIKNDFIFMYLGSISPSADVETLIKSFQVANLPGAKLEIVGTGSDKEKCMSAACKLGNNKIKFYEATPDKVPEIQSHADVLLLPLKKGISMTATPSKLTAYLLSGKPVIASVETESDVANIIKEANCGFVVEPENVKSMAFRMKHVYSLNKKELEKFGVNGKGYAVLNLSKKTNLQKLVAVIENTIQWK
jgi:glycosyltransferase involved in cell wall biosynthesis